MTKTVTIIRILLGLMMFIFGLNAFLQFIPVPLGKGSMVDFLSALAATGYLLPLVALVEIVCGVSLLLNKYTALALIILFPVLLNAFLAHLFLDISGIGGAAFALAMTIGLFFAYRKHYGPLFCSDPVSNV